MEQPYSPVSYTINIRSPFALPKRRKIAWSMRTEVLHYQVKSPLYLNALLGLSAHTLKAYAPGAAAHLDYCDVFVVPADFYKPGEWPHHHPYYDGRPFTQIFQLIHISMCHEEDVIALELANSLEELLAFHSAFKILSMPWQVQQVEAMIVRTLQERCLEIEEVKTIWRYFESGASARDRPEAFGNHNIMVKFAANVRDWTVPRWKSAKLQDQSHLVYSLQEWHRFLNENMNLFKLVYYPDLRTYVTIYAPKADNANSIFRDKWISDNFVRFGRAVPQAMPPILENGIEQFREEGSTPSVSWEESEDELPERVALASARRALERRRRGYFKGEDWENWREEKQMRNILSR